MFSPAVAGCVGENLRRYRRRAGLSQEELSFRASLHRTAVGQLERAERTARADTLVKLAGALAISPGDLLEGIVWREPVTSAGSFERSAPETAP
jgi:transcriptional regulator with XRE-family HTH domain